MRRFFATLIDIVLTQIIFFLATNNFFIGKNLINSLLVQFSYMGFFLLYNYICDSACDRNTIGKKIFNLKTNVPISKNRAYNFTHGILRFISFVFLPITILFYVFIGKGKLPYDLWYESETIHINDIKEK